MRSVSARAEVPDVMKRSCGEEEARREGTSASVKTIVPETLMSKLRFHASRNVRFPAWCSPSKFPPALLMRVSILPL